MHHFTILLMLVMLLAPAAAAGCESAPDAEIDAADIDAVQAQRAAFNAAIATEACGGDFCPAAEEPAP